ncbi:pyridoxamine 5'-phosphate oxidase family protein [Flavobacterium hydatis]|uniref:Flavin-nucleotide-binding protein n=1 Tax=Flavobacterium hydatis TaxID=991 RepID=A0A086AMN0_FLAHY|nr:pyridoxamine 5'-phosphate oxidase family protein [Flavobacterium hydatis]KFF17944.1 flavin-nucleotide-binding protein [Flavobacterium hydatis]OXA90890.1 flavin-nucleotide-binding protein [Flavobacterium hydatis]
MINDDVKKYIKQSVLCWLATSDKDNMPNVSPKEIFTYQDDSTLLIAHLASPNSANNILENPNVCVSFIDVFVQKGYKLKGTAKLIDKENPDFQTKLKPLTDLFSDKYPIKAVIEITITKIETIKAPSYYLYPETTEESQINDAMATYNVSPKQ